MEWRRILVAGFAYVAAGLLTLSVNVKKGDDAVDEAVDDTDSGAGEDLKEVGAEGCTLE